MKLWRRVTGALKDKFRLVKATNDPVTVAIIKSTSHDDLSMDFKNIQFIYSYVQSNPSSSKQIIRTIFLRMERTRNWTVVLKSLMLIHGLFLNGNPTVNSIGRLPFDLSDFGKSKSRFSKSSRFSIFVRAYFLFLDERSILFFHNDVIEDPRIIVEMQRIVDLLMIIKPIGQTMETPLVTEAMKYVVNEILQTYTHISRGVADFLIEFKLSSENSLEATKLARKIVAKSLSHGEELIKYFEICKEFGVTNAQETLDLVRLTECDMMVIDKLLRNSHKLDRLAKIIPVTEVVMVETNSSVQTSRNFFGPRDDTNNL